MALFTALTESEAKLIPGRVKTPSIAGDKISRRWEYIDATVADTLTASVPATVTDPYADGQKYEGTYAVGSQLAQAQDDRSVTVTQELTLINTLVSEADPITLSTLSPLKEYDNEILRAFSLQEGEGDRISWTYKNINPANRAVAMAYSDAELETLLGADTGEYLSRSFTLEEDGTATFVIITEGHTWLAWGHDSSEEDKLDYDNAGTANERERITKTWVGIKFTDLADAIADIRIGTTTGAESGYIITSASVNDREDGSLTLVQTQKKQVDNVDAGNLSSPQNDHVNPHGWDGGRIDTIETHYEHFTATGLATAISGEGVPTGYVEVKVTESIDGDGLYSRIYYYQLPTFTNVTDPEGEGADKVITNQRIVGYTNQDPQNEKFGVGSTVTDSSDGIPIADLAEVRDNQIADAGYAIQNVTVRDNKDGSGTLQRNQIKKRTKIQEFVTGFTSAQGTRAESQTVIWRDLSSTDADLIVADAIANEDAMTSATYASALTSHVLKRIETPFQTGVDSDGEQLFSVVRTTWIPTANGTSYSGVGVGETLPWKISGKYYNTGQPNRPNLVFYIVILDRKITASFSEATAFAQYSHTLPLAPAVPNDARKLGGVDWDDGSKKWTAIKETWWLSTDAVGVGGVENDYSNVTSIFPVRQAV